MLKDLKESLSSARKADITHVRKHFMIYTARPCELGTIKYVRGNYLRPTGDGPHTTPTGADFDRLTAYVRAALSHLGETLQAMEVHRANDPELRDVAGMKRAAYAIDTDITPGAKVGASNLPHIAPACASLMMGIEQAVACGLLPADPGQPWTVLAEVPAPVTGSREDLRKLDPFEPVHEENYTSYARVGVTKSVQIMGDVQKSISFPAGTKAKPSSNYFDGVPQPGVTWGASDLSGLAARENWHDANEQAEARARAAHPHAPVVVQSDEQQRNDRVDAICYAMQFAKECATYPTTKQLIDNKGPSVPPGAFERLLKLGDVSRTLGSYDPDAERRLAAEERLARADLTPSLPMLEGHHDRKTT